MVPKIRWFEKSGFHHKIILKEFYNTILNRIEINYT